MQPGQHEVVERTLAYKIFSQLVERQSYKNNRLSTSPQPQTLQLSCRLQPQCFEKGIAQCEQTFTWLGRFKKILNHAFIL